MLLCFSEQVTYQLFLSCVPCPSPPLITGFTLDSQSQVSFLLVSLFVFKTGFPAAVEPVLELALWTILALNSPTSATRVLGLKAYASRARQSQVF